MKRSRIDERRNVMLRNSIDDGDNIDVRMCKCDIYRIGLWGIDRTKRVASLNS